MGAGKGEWAEVGKGWRCEVDKEGSATALQGAWPTSVPLVRPAPSLRPSTGLMLTSRSKKYMRYNRTVKVRSIQY